MPALTRRAIRVCTALTELRGRGGDVLDALTPFFEPIFELSNGKIFDPRAFALGVQKLYKWRFTTDIAEQFIPRLVRAGFLERIVSSGPDAAYLVRYQARDDIGTVALSEVLSEIVDEFQRFSPRLTNLLTYNRSRDELSEILINFLVSLDAYAPAEFAAQLKTLKPSRDEQDTLDQLEEGGKPLPQDDRYMAARFVQTLCAERPEYIADLSRLASVGLLTEVVEDFVKPVQIGGNTDLVVILDAPLALDYLGCSGTQLKADVSCILDSLRQIGCNIVALPVTCDEMQRNLKAMLANKPPDRHGYTHNAIIRREVMIDYVQAVANNTEQALTKSGVTVLPYTLQHFPGQHNFFSSELFEDFLSTIVWVQEIPPREHDATCLALAMRLRQGRHSSDLFRCKYVFVTRNARFVRDARSYCIENMLLNENHEGPVIHQRELATITWLRTGLGASELVPKSHLLAYCDRVLNLKKEVRDTVGQKIKAVTPDKYEQFELLLLDQKSIRRLADLTLNDETVITDENAEQLLEAMRSATVEEEKAAFDKRLREERSNWKGELKKAREQKERAEGVAGGVIRERDKALEKLEEVRKAKIARIGEIVTQTNRIVGRFDGVTTACIFIAAIALILNSIFHWYPPVGTLSAIVGTAMILLGGYHQLMKVLERPTIGVPTIMGWLAKLLVRRKLVQAGLAGEVNVADIQIDQGRVSIPQAALGESIRTAVQFSRE
jgi:hypothetical protein